MVRIALTLCAALVSPLVASAASSQWENVEGAAVRVVLAPGDDGTMRGALDIRLEPGWKTYWRDPGDAGVPPTVEASLHDGTTVPVEVGFPAPQRHDDGYSVWAGYDHSVAFPLTLGDISADHGPVSLSVFLGVCETICVPVQAKLVVEPGSGTGPDAQLIDAAFAALPGDATDEFGVSSVERNGEELLVHVQSQPGARAVDLFVSSSDSYFFDQPIAVDASDGMMFRVAILAWDEDWNAESIHYTLTADGDAASGTFTIGD